MHYYAVNTDSYIAHGIFKDSKSEYNHKKLGLLSLGVIVNLTPNNGLVRKLINLPSLLEIM